MNANKKYKQGEIYLIKLHPSTGKELKKFRPAVVMFDNPTDDFVTVAPLTSIIKVNLPTLEFVLHPSSTNGLNEKSLLMGWYLRTIDIELVQKYLGKLSPLDLKQLHKTFRALLH